MSSSAALQQEAAIARTGLSSALDDLRNSVTTTALTEGALTFAKEGSNAVARATIDKAMANPLAAMLIGAGVVMLMAGKDTKVGAVVDRGNSAIRTATGSVLDTATSAYHTTADTAGGAVDKVKEVASGAASMAGGAYDKAREMAAAGQEQGRQAIEQGKQAIDDAQKMIAESKTRLEQFAQEQPILVAALGVAFGAALGAALPMTKVEQDYLGDKSRKLGEQGLEVGKKIADAVTGKLAGENLDTKVGEVVDAVTGTVASTISKPAG